MEGEGVRERVQEAGFRVQELQGDRKQETGNS
jgi:hypothetical protein